MNVMRFLSTYLKAEQFEKAAPRTVTISAVTAEEMGPEGERETKLVVYFKELEQGLVPGASVRSRLFNEFGEESDNWVGKQVVLFYDPEVYFGNKRTGGIRVRFPEPAKAKAK